jgi:rod shape determining protein RodA
MTTISGYGTHRQTRSNAISWRRADLSLLAATVLVTGFGLLMVYSATRGTGAQPNRSYLDRQMTFAFVGVVLMVITMLVDYRRLRGLVVLAYVGLIGVLLLVPVIGVDANGARAWFRVGPFQLQPSEFGKIVVIVALAAFFTTDRESPRLRHLLIGLGITALPAAIIMLQPDLGTVLVYVALTTAVLVVAGVRPRQLLFLAVVVVLGTFVTLRAGVLDEYQVDRLTAFVDNKPTAQNKEVFAHQENAQTAIGNGGLLGKGLFEGPQNRSRLVPEKQTDFIFTVVGEELGFAGGAVLIGLYGIMILRIWRIGSTAPDLFGTLICAGVLAMLMFQIFESMGMSTGIMPITGIPLPFFSYGGSSILASFVGIGLVESVYLRRFA